MENDADFRVASFSCYLKPRETKQSSKKFSHIFRRASLCLTMKPVDQFVFPDLTDKPKQFEEKPRKYCELFHSNTINKGDIIKTLERKMSVSTQANEEIVYDDVASDASSDLFEIEIFSRNGSFTEFSSTYSDYDEKRAVDTTATCQMTPVKNKSTYSVPRMFRKPHKTTAASLLGCRSQHSVKVAEPVYKTSNKSKH